MRSHTSIPKMKLLTLFAVLCCVNAAMSSAIGTKTETKKMVCYYGSWAVYRWGAGKFDVENIDPHLCTHVIFGFAGINPATNTIRVLDPYNELYDDYGKGAYLRFTGLKRINPQLKTILAVGGWNEGSINYSNMAADPTKRAVFIQSVIDLLVKYNFDGMDFDWEYPADRGGNPYDKENYITVITELKNALAPRGLMLTCATAVGASTVEHGFDVAAMSKIFDQIHIMAYDFHGTWETFTGHNAPLFSNPNIESGDQLTLNIDYAVRNYIAKGADPSKLILGMPLYGHGFTLNDPSKNGYYEMASQPIPAGPFTQQSGTWGYNEICDRFTSDPGWTIVRDPYYQAPYAYKGSLWIGYDDQESMKAKAEYAAYMNLGGAMVWSIETDDFHGTCDGKPFSLIKTIIEAINGPIVIPTTPAPLTTPSTMPTVPTTAPTTVPTVPTTAPTTAPTVPTTAPTTAPTVPTTGPTTIPTVPTTNPTNPTTPRGPTTPHIICQSAGLFANPDDCHMFYQCSINLQGGWTVESYTCSQGTVFNPEIGSCDWPYKVPGCENPTF